MISKDSSNAPGSQQDHDVDAYFLATVFEDRAESAGPPPWMSVTGDRGEDGR
ncbi:MAG: hypothetical protein NT113_04800 [Hyphomicrobiales bacterium]|jgi:hypothetical protein|nr:hypothetical protein [Hyphomicrobiales bacterium]